MMSPQKERGSVKNVEGTWCYSRALGECKYGFLKGDAMAGACW